MSKQRFASVWDALEDTPQQAASMRARSELMMALQTWVKQENLTQAQAAALLGVTQPRISDLIRGRINLFSTDTLIDMAATAGLTPSITIKAPKRGKKKTVSDLMAA
jgi:predicted XRE-type DNA-binding protein